MHSSIAAFAFVLGLSFTSVPALAAGPIQTAPAVKTFNVGSIVVRVLKAGRLAIPNDGSVFGLNARPVDVAEVLRAAGQQTDTIYLDIDVLLVRSNKRLVLIDTGYGPKNDSVLMQSLSLASISPAEITDILITHTHPDHVGGLVDGSGRSAFPNAIIHMSANEWRFMKSEADARDIAVAVRGQVRTFDPGEEVVPGIQAKAAYGHTPGHVMYEIASGEEQLLDMGDVAHSSIVSLGRPDWGIAWDQARDEGTAERGKELDRLAQTHERVFAVHFPFPGVGFIARGKPGFSFAPSVPHETHL